MNTKDKPLTYESSCHILAYWGCTSKWTESWNSVYSLSPSLSLLVIDLPINKATLQSGQKPETPVYCLKGASSRRGNRGHVWDQHCEKGRLGLCPGVKDIRAKEYKLCFYCVFMNVIWMKNSKYGMVYKIVIFKISFDMFRTNLGSSSLCCNVTMRLVVALHVGISSLQLSWCRSTACQSNIGI